VKNGSVIDKITSYYSISSVLILLYMCPHTTIYVSCIGGVGEEWVGDRQHNNALLRQLRGDP
jgi:hypothetical protein